MDKKIADYVCRCCRDGSSTLEQECKMKWLPKTCPTIQAILALMSQEQKPMVEALGKFIEWNTKYPSSRIYSESAIRVIAAELDAICEEAKKAVGIDTALGGTQ